MFPVYNSKSYLSFIKVYMKRLEELDTIRGLMILWMLVVHISLNYGHIIFGTPFQRFSIFSWMSFFMVPFFFFSGFCFKEGVPFMTFLKKKALTLIVPYIFYTIAGGGYLFDL